MGIPSISIYVNESFSQNQREGLIFTGITGMLSQQARMVELVDTLVSGTSAFSGMEVQVFFRAKENYK